MKRFVIVLLVALCFLASCNWWQHEPSPVYVSGEMRVDGSVTGANIFYRVFDGVGTNEQYAAPLPWSFVNDRVRAGESFYLAAQSNDATGDMTVTVTIDGIPFMSETTITPFGFVAIYGVIP